MLPFQTESVAILGVLKEVHAEVVARTNSAEPPHRYLTLRGYLTRALGWLTTLSKVNSNMEFQAIAGAARGLLESACDCLSIHGDLTLKTITTIDAWEKSAQLKCNETIVKYYDAHPPLPDEFKPALVSMKSEEAQAVAAERQARWNGAHPQRWASLSLQKQCAAVDGMAICKACQFATLEDIYVEHVPVWNLWLHGSGFALLHQTAPVIDRQCKGMLLHSWFLASTVALVAAHEVSLGEATRDRIMAAVASASARCRPLLDGPVPPSE